jgi:hypothetical protein
LASTVTDADVAAAAAEAETAQRAFLDLEHQALYADPASRPTAAMVAAQREEAALAAQRVEVTRQRAEETRRAVRLAALEQVGAEIDALAGEGHADPTMADALKAVAESAAAFHTAAAAWDGKVRALHLRAAELGSEPGQAGQAGPAASSGYVQRGGVNGAVRHRDTEVAEVGQQAAQAAGLAAAGQLQDALALIAVVRDRSPRQPDGYYRDVIGQFPPMPVFGQPDRSLAMMVSEGRAVRMTDAEVEAWKGKS